MTNKEIRQRARVEVEENYDSLLFFSLMKLIVGTVSKAVPVVGDAFTAPLEFSNYSVFERRMNYQRVTMNDFLKYFRYQWAKAFGYKARALFYTVKNLLIAIVVGLVTLLATPLFSVIISMFSNPRSALSYKANFAALGILGAFLAIYFIVLAVLIILLIPRYLSTAAGMYILYKNPKMNSKNALHMSLEVMNGNRWSLFCMGFGLIPEAIKSLFLGYGLPVINASILMALDQYYQEEKRYNPVLFNEEPIEDVCEVCGTLKRDDSKYCRRCGSEY